MRSLNSERNLTGSEPPRVTQPIGHQTEILRIGIGHQRTEAHLIVPDFPVVVMEAELHAFIMAHLAQPVVDGGLFLVVFLGLALLWKPEMKM